MQEIITTILVSTFIVAATIFSLLKFDKSKLIASYSFIILRVLLGAVFIMAGATKYSNDPKYQKPTQIQTIEKLSEYQEGGNDEYFSLTAYMDGMKHTGFAYDLLAITEIIAGILLVLQFTGIIGALFLLPITLHIFLLHLVVGSGETYELIFTGVLFVANLLVLLQNPKIWSNLIWIRPIIRKH